MSLLNPMIAALAARTRKGSSGMAVPASVPNATLSTRADGTAVWAVGKTGDLWSIDSEGTQGWRAPKIHDLPAASAATVAELAAPQGGLVSISIGSLLSLSAGANALQAQVEALRARLNDEVRRSNAMYAELVRVGLVAPKQ